MGPPLNRAAVHSTLKIIYRQSSILIGPDHFKAAILADTQLYRFKHTSKRHRYKYTITNIQVQIHIACRPFGSVQNTSKRHSVLSFRLLLSTWHCQASSWESCKFWNHAFSFSSNPLSFPMQWGNWGIHQLQIVCYSNLSFWLWRVLISAVTPPRVKRNLLARQNERSQKCFMHSSRHSFNLWVLFLPLGGTTFILNHECMNSSSSI